MSDKKAKPKTTKSTKKDLTRKESSKSKSKSKPKDEKEKTKKLKKDTSKKTIKTNSKSIQPEEEKFQTTPISQFAPEEGQSQLLSEREKCEGCFQGVGFCFCSTCGRIYCKICDDQMHMVPLFRTHERVPLDQVLYLKQMCYHHHLSLKLFCESCKEPICSQCQIIGPHNNKLHQITSIIESYRNKFKAVNELIEKHVAGKADKLESAMIAIEQSIIETKDTSSKIQKGIQSEYDTINESIMKAEGKKHAVLNYNSTLIQKKMKVIGSILETVDSFNMQNGIGMCQGSNSGSGSCSVQGRGMVHPLLMVGSIGKMNDDAISFLLQYKLLQESIDNVISIPIPELKDNDLYSWPKDFEATKEKLNQYDNLVKLIKIKDDIIWNIITNKSNQDNEELQLLKTKTQNEINEWSKLTDKYANELKKYNKVCAFCGCYLDSNTMNTHCDYNKTKTHDYLNKNYIQNQPPIEIIGMRQHYFDVPSQGYEEKSKSRFGGGDGAGIGTRGSLLHNSNPFESNLMGSSNKAVKNNQRYSNNNMNMTYTWVNKIAAVISKDKINLYQLLSEYDFGSSGYISLEDLTNAMGKIHVNLDKREYDSIIQYYQMSGMNQINIKLFTQNFI